MGVSLIGCLITPAVLLSQAPIPTTTPSATQQAMSHSSMRNVLRLFPELTNSLHKGSCGRICVIGGSIEYTGAPWFSAISAMRIGADLGYVCCAPPAAPVIKSYSPELIVYPTLEFDEIRSTLDKMHALVFGAGLGRDKAIGVPLLKHLLGYARERPSNCFMVIDADGLFMLPDCLSQERPAYTNVLLTPNTREFQRLFEQVFPGVEYSSTDTGSDEAKVKRLAGELRMSVMLKGAKEIISDGQTVLIGDHPGSPRRCGGLGDILGGASALFTYWHKLKRASPSGEGDYQVEDLLEGAKAASDFVRYASSLTFERMRRSMVAGDVIAHIPEAIRALEQQGK